MPTYARSGLTQQKPTEAQLGDAAAEAKCLTLQLVRDLIDGGFDVYTVDDNIDLVGSATNADIDDVVWSSVTLKPTTAVDPLVDEDPWLIRLRVGGLGQGREVVNGVSGQIVHPNTGLFFKVGAEEMLSGANITGPALKEYAIIPPTWGGGITTEQASVLGPYSGVTYARISPSFPMDYRLTIAERGFVLAAFHPVLTEDLAKMGVVCVQHGIKCDGTMEDTDTRPLILLTNINPSDVIVAQVTGNTEQSTPRNAWYYEIVRMSDNISPYPFWTNTNQTMGVVNGTYYTDNLVSDPREFKGSSLQHFPVRWYTPVTTDRNEYILRFPGGFSSARFLHPEEMDLIAISKADAYQSSQEVPLTIYGEQRKYTALSSNNQNVAYDAGIRVFILTDSPAL